MKSTSTPLNNTFRLSAILSVVRHGEKDEQGQLTENGEKQAVEKGSKLRFLKGNISIHHSGVERVRKTALAISRSLINQFQDSANLGVNHPELQLDELHYQTDRSKKSIYFEDWNRQLPQNEHNTRVQNFLNHNNTSPEIETTPSPLILAKRLALTLNSQILKALSTSYDIKENYINVTHEPVAMSFLYYVMNDFKPSGENFVSEIGGSINFAEGLDISLYQSKSNHSLLLLDFREFLIQIPLEKLIDFAS